MSIKSRTITLLSVIMLGALLLEGCDRDRTKVTRTVELSGPIREIVVEGCWTVQLSQSSDVGVSLEYSSFLGDKISAKVDDGCLRLKLRNAFIGVTHDDLNAVVSLPNITRIKASGAARVGGNGIFRGELLEVILNGASSLNSFNYKGNNVKIELGGASKCRMKGEAEKVGLSFGGASKAYMLDFITNKLDLDIGGASYVEMTINKSVEGKLSGASTLTICGNADISTLKLRGGSKVKRVQSLHTCTYD